MQQNPFSLYDFLAHLIPGVFFIFIVTLVFKIDYSCYLAELNFDATTTSGNTIIIIVFIVCAYIIGQLFSFLSSRTIETYSNIRYKYPSVFLLKLNWDDEKEKKFGFKFIRVIINFIILHVVIVDKVISFIIGDLKLIDKPLDESMRNAVLEKIMKLFKKLKIDKNVNLGNGSVINVDFHRVVMHYTFEHSLKHQSKLNNYVALYGFHRSMSLVFNLTAWFVLGMLASSLISINIHDILVYIIAFLSCVIISYMFFISFMKFYRRFTLEGFMVLMIDKEI